MKTYNKIFSWVFKVGYLILGLGVIYFVFYLFSFQYLRGPLQGNDIPNAFIYIQWLDHYFPKIPIWWPEQGGGASFIYGHQIGSYFIILFLHKVLSFTLIHGMRLLGFFSVYLTCVGIYFFTWYKTKSQTASLLAGVFYLLSDVIWRWLFDMGLYAQSVSFMWVPFIFIAFDSYLVAYKNKEESKKRRRLFLTALLYCLAIFNHIVTGYMLAIILPLYALFYFQLEKWDRGRILRIWDSVKTSVLAGVLGFFILAVWIFPYVRFFVEEGRDGVLLAGIHQIPYFSILSFFGYFPDISKFEMWHVSTILGVGILFFLGLIIALFKQRSLAAWGLVALAFFLVMISPSINFSFMTIFYKYFGMVGVRGVLVTSIIFPVLAGYTCVAIPEVFILPILKMVKGRLSGVVAGMGRLIISVVAVAIAGVFIYFFRIPGDTKFCGKETYIGFGPSTQSGYCQFLKDYLAGKGTLPKFTLGTDDIVEGPYVREVIAAVDPGIDSRIDITPSLGNIMERWNIYSHTSQFSLYAYGISLLRTMWGYQQWLFYGHLNTNPAEVVAAAKWFGIQRVVAKIGDNYDNLDNFPAEYWNTILTKSDGTKAFELREKVNLAEVSSRPTFLVIGDHKLRAYEQIFRLANKGAFPYEEYYFAEGESKFVDDYDLTDLNRFDGVVLHAYAYKNRGRAETTLEKYVQDGGKLWIETGWQYVSPDWNLETTPGYFPLKSQKWFNLGVVTDYSLNKTIVPGIDEKQFAALEWKGSGWGFSSSEGALKDWAIPVLSADNYPLVVVGNYGKGKVVWSGMNLFSHAYDDKSAEEVKFIGALGTWFFGSAVPENGTVTYSRIFPDTVNFSVTDAGKWLLFKESYSPGWRATLTASDGSVHKLSYYRGGPGFMLVSIPVNYARGNVKIVLHYTQSWATYLGFGVTVLTLAGFILYLFGVDKKIFPPREAKAGPQVISKGIMGQVKGWWNRDEEE